MLEFDRIIILSGNEKDRQEYEYHVANMSGRKDVSVPPIVNVPIEYCKSVEALKKRLSAYQFDPSEEFKSKLAATVTAGDHTSKESRILVVDDDQTVREYFGHSLMFHRCFLYDSRTGKQILVLYNDLNRKVDVAIDADDAYRKFLTTNYAIVLTDLWMPTKAFRRKYRDWNKPSILSANDNILAEGFTGVKLIERLKTLPPELNKQTPEIIAFSRYWDHPSVQRLCAPRIYELCGIGILPKFHELSYHYRVAFDNALDSLVRYSHLPVSTFGGFLDTAKLAVEEIKVTEGLLGIIGESEQINGIRKQINSLHNVDVNVLIVGESGTGKELVAHAIHNTSRRSKRAMIAVNSAAIPDGLTESELFGHSKGAFTGAISIRDGKFKIANESTLFLDEIGDLSLSAQAKLLRVIETGVFEPLGSNVTVHVNVRIIAATNKDLAQEIREGRFREDLYYRLASFPIHIPPLRERKCDIPLLTEHFRRTLCSKHDRTVFFTESALKKLSNHDWHGNVRELKNTVERAIIVSEKGIVKAEAITFMDHTSNHKVPGLFTTLREMEITMIREALRAEGCIVTQAAKRLGISRSSLHIRMKRYGITPKKAIDGTSNQTTLQ
jgi:transcriptional regulator with AAA-type ATPase domain/CheY-like chemotaxis protein